jgi:hypothetical protein
MGEWESGRRRKRERRQGGCRGRQGGGDKPDIREWFLKTAATIIGGLGTAGAMVVIGSAVLWVRFREAGIPAVQAVSVQPKQEALVQGAQTTIFFVLAAPAAVVILCISDFREPEKDDGNSGGKKDRRAAPTRG